MRSAHTVTTQPSPESLSHSEATILEWRVHLVRAAPAKALAVAGAIVIAFAVGTWSFDTWVIGAVGALLVFSAAAEFMLPIRYRLSTEGAKSSYGLARLEIRWSSVRRVLDAGHSLRLSPMARRSLLDNLRGVELRFAAAPNPGHRDEVVAIVRERMEDRKHDG